MKIQLFSDVNNLPVDRKEWNSLLSSSETNTPFQTYEWFRSWWKVFGSKQNLFIFTARAGEKLIGLAPLMISNQARRAGEVQFIADEKSDYCDFIICEQKPDFIRAVIDYLLNHPELWGIINLRNIPEQSSTVTILKEICKNRNISFLDSTCVCPTLVLNECDDVRRLAVPKSLRRHLNYFQRTGELSFRVLDSVDEALGCLDVFFQQHIERRSITKDKSLFLSSSNRRFYRELVKQTADTGWLFFSCLEHEGCPIAFHFGFDYNSKVIWYKPSFDIALRRRSPGRMLIKYLIEYCADNKKDELDFTLGVEKFKDYYTNANSKNINITIYRRKYNYMNDKIINISRSIIKRLWVRIWT